MFSGMIKYAVLTMMSYSKYYKDAYEAQKKLVAESGFIVTTSVNSLAFIFTTYKETKPNLLIYKTLIQRHA